MAPRYGVKTPILLMLLGTFMVLAVWPGRAMAYHNPIANPWPGDPAFHGFVPGHEMDYILDVFWRPKEYTRIGLQDFLACGDMRIRKDGEIHYTKYGTRLCSSKERYRLVEATPNYIALYVKDLTPPNKLRPYVRFQYWVLSYAGVDDMDIHRCDYTPPPYSINYVGDAGFSMSQQDLLDKWNKNVLCNPKFLDPNRFDYFSDPYSDLGYYIIRSNRSPAYKDGRFIYK